VLSRTHCCPYDQVNPESVSLFTTLTTLYTVITRPPIEVPFGYGLARAQRTVGAGRRRGVVVTGVRRMNEVNERRARLVPGWVTVFRQVYHLRM